MNNDVNNNPFNFKPNTAPEQPSDAAAPNVTPTAEAPVQGIAPSTPPAAEPVSQVAQPASPDPQPEAQIPSPPVAEPAPTPVAPEPAPAPEPIQVEAPASPSIPEVPVAPEPAPSIEAAPAPAASANPMQEQTQNITETPSAVVSETPSASTEPAIAPEQTVAPSSPMVNKIAESEGKLDQPEQTTQNNIPNPSSPEVMFRNEKQQMEIEAQRQAEQSKNEKPEFNKNELTRLFVGKNYDKVMTNRINFSALFLSPPYFFYRKMAIYGLGTILVQILTNIILLAFLPKIVTYIIQLGVCILWGVLFNKLYIRYVNSSVDEIMKKSNSMDEAKKLCINDGGTNAGYVLLSIAVSAILSAAIFALFPALMVAVLGNTLTP